MGRADTSPRPLPCGEPPHSIFARARVCGGSRARAYARTGDELASDPLCPYQP
ncbi:MAG: hypothetical protein QN122_04015 [Armatimonadota bacterium]|nr:hypothetical protein [Armatimonadota bacterium]MDR7449777.1 hypothetical protein [Armatimonadota bacterium]MDR7458414.1 hypothetical protein [Armatimonadota bacterium]MDR7478784.1 hypothetical protein [Armatimonadota bacterium]MDR7488242.1 hypothetical protein [Armatimonadota bacterium]